MTHYYGIFQFVFNSIFNIAITFGLLLLIYLFFFSGIRARKDLKPVKYISYKRIIFRRILNLSVSFADPRYLPRVKNVQPVVVILGRTKSIS